MPRLDRPALTTATANLIARRTPYLDPELPTLRGLVRAGDVCVDVGSAAGLYSQALSHLAGPAGLVHSIEPLPFSHPVWSRVLGARKRRNVVHHTIALGAKPGRAVMRVPFGSYGPATSRSFLASGTTGLGSTSGYRYHVDMLVETGTLDRLCTEAQLTRLDFVKIDVEGGELHVLEGGQQTIETFRPTLLIEIEARHTDRYPYSPDDVVEWLTSRGYTMHAWRNGWRVVHQICLHTNNYLFRPTGTVQPGQAAHQGGSSA